MRYVVDGETEELYDLKADPEELKNLADDPITKLGISRGAPIVKTVGDKDIVSYTLETDLGWRLTVMQDADEAYAVIDQARIEAIVSSGILIVGIIVFSLLLSGSISTPIRRLSEVAETYSKGDMEAFIPGTDRGDEIGDLARSIERLGSGLQVIMGRLGSKTS